ncbi:MAG: EexN family lipoprotein [Woeseiaceae bacterium]
MYATSRKLLPMLICSSLLVGACSSERPARSVQEFIDNPQFLEAAVVRCSVNRAESRYEVECVNARQAVAIIEAREERSRRDNLEAESEAKRDALRRTQRAAAAARREAVERARRREEEEYLAQFGEVPPPVDNSGLPELEANTPGAVIPAPVASDETYVVDTSDDVVVVFDEPVRTQSAPAPAADGANAPVVDNAPVANSESETDLDSIRDELKRRQDESPN